MSDTDAVLYLPWGVWCAAPVSVQAFRGMLGCPERAAHPFCSFYLYFVPRRALEDSLSGSGVFWTDDIVVNKASVLER